MRKYTMATKIDLAGQRFERLVVLEPAGKNKHGQYIWKCECDCGKITFPTTYDLRTGHTKSCGCYGKEKLKQSVITHGERHSSTYNTWCSMKGRCYTSSNTSYNRYGARGIAVCDRWKDSFENFLEDMGHRPSPKHCLDRIDNDGPYSPDNCRWVTYTENNRNRRDSRILPLGEESMTMAAWGERLDISVVTIFNRLERGESIDRALHPFNIKTGERLKQSNKISYVHKRK
jgi:hypothetical protein